MYLMLPGWSDHDNNLKCRGDEFLCHSWIAMVNHQPILLPWSITHMIQPRKSFWKHKPDLLEMLHSQLVLLKAYGLVCAYLDDWDFVREPCSPCLDFFRVNCVAVYDTVCQTDWHITSGFLDVDADGEPGVCFGENSDLWMDTTECQVLWSSPICSFSFDYFAIFSKNWNSTIVTHPVIFQRCVKFVQRKVAIEWKVKSKLKLKFPVEPLIKSASFCGGVVEWCVKELVWQKTKGFPDWAAHFLDPHQDGFWWQPANERSTFFGNIYLFPKPQWTCYFSAKHWTSKDQLFCQKRNTAHTIHTNAEFVWEIHLGLPPREIGSIAKQDKWHNWQLWPQPSAETVATIATLNNKSLLTELGWVSNLVPPFSWPFLHFWKDVRHHVVLCVSRSFLLRAATKGKNWL